MIFNWNSELINDSVLTLNNHQRAALDCFISLSKGQTKPGPVRLKRFGFTDLPDYESNLAAARKITVAHFAKRGIRRVDDLSFAEPNRSTDDRIEKAVRKAAA
jgi:hypothetical protein